MAGVHWYHKLNMALIGLGPVALMMPSEWTFPVDLALGVIIPLHSHLGAPPPPPRPLGGAAAVASSERAVARRQGATT